MAHRWPFAARSDELHAAARALGLGSVRRGLVLRGSRGVGKTRLARELLARLELQGVVTRWSVGTESARGVPLGAFGPLLGPLSGHSQDLLVRAADGLLRGPGVPRGRPLLVVVDDAHLLDELSALLVHHLVVHTEAAVLVTVRDGETPPDAVTALWKDEYLPQTEVRALSEEATATVVSAALGGELDATATAAFWRLTGGNPLFLRHLVDGERTAGRLAAVGPVWRWSGEPQLTRGLIQLVEQQMGALSSELVEVVDLLALAEPLPADLLGDLVDPLSVERAEQRGLITVDTADPPTAHLGHPLYGEVRRSRMGRLRARRTRARIAAALAPTEAGPSDRLRRAVLLVDSDATPDAALFTDGAITAMQLTDLSLAERLARSAAAAGGEFPARLTLAYALCFLHRGAESDTEFAALAEEDLGPVEALTVGLSRAANLLWEVGAVDEARAVLDAVEGRLGHDPDGAIAAMRGTVEGAAGRPLQARLWTERALSVPTISPVATLAASYGLVGAMSVLGQADELDAAAARGYAAAKTTDQVSFLRFGLAHLHLNGLWLAGRIAASEALAEDWYAQSLRLPGVSRLHGAGLVGQAAVARGRLRTARTLLREVTAGLPAHRLNPFRYVVSLHLTVALAKSGDAAGARIALADVEAFPHPAFGFLAPEALLARAWVAAAEGSPRRSLASCHAAADLARGLGQPAHEVLALQTAVGFGDASVADRLDWLVLLVGGPRAVVAAAWARAWAERDPDRLVAASTELEEIGDWVAAADAATQAASVLADRGRSGTAAVAAARALALAERCEGARTPAVQALARPLPLTARQLEIVALASTGLSNTEIARRLVVSVRTVEGHLYRASERLGVTSRTELAAIYAGLNGAGLNEAGVRQSRRR